MNHSVGRLNRPRRELTLGAVELAWTQKHQPLSLILLAAWKESFAEACSALDLRTPTCLPVIILLVGIPVYRVLPPIERQR